MIKTLKFSNGANAAVGNVQVQPATSDPLYNVKQQVGNTNVVLSTAESSLGSKVVSFTKSGGNMNIATGQSVTALATALITDRSAVVPSYQTTKNSVVPNKSKAIVLTGGLLSKFLPLKFDSYEELTGISQDRPEIVSMVNFEPIFQKPFGQNSKQQDKLLETNGIYADMTPAGKFIETYYQARQLACSDVIQLLRVVTEQYPDIKKEVEARYGSFSSCIEAIKLNAYFLASLVSMMERAKNLLDLKNVSNTVSLQSAVNDHYTNYTKLAAFVKSNELYESVTKHIKPSFTVVDVLEKLGYNRNSIVKTFSSTKMWLQLLVELKDILRYHSQDLLDTEKTQQKLDDSSCLTTRLSTKHFALKQATIPHIAELISFDYTRRYEVTKWLKQAWSSLYQNALFKTPEIQAAALANLVTKEFRYSVSMNDEDAKKALNDLYYYKVSDFQNDNVFDSIIGRIGNNISDFSTSYTNSLVNAAQQRAIATASSYGILTFESKYVEADNGTLTPGGVYFVDGILDAADKAYDTKRMAELSTILGNINKSANVVTNAMNLMATFNNNIDPSNKVQSHFTSYFCNPTALVNLIAEKLIDVKTGLLLKPIENDNLATLYTLAASNTAVKATLFYYVMTRITRQYYREMFINGKDNTALSNNLAKDVIQQTINSVKQTLPVTHYNMYSAKPKAPYVTADGLHSSLKSSTAISELVEFVMSSALYAFKYNNKAVDGASNKTRFGGYTDTLMMMALFDLLVSVIAKFSQKYIVSYSAGNTSYIAGHTTFHLSDYTGSSRSQTHKDITNRLDKEIALTSQCLYTVFSVLRNVSESMMKHVNAMNGAMMVNGFKKLTDTINDSKLVKMLMSEQQILTLMASVNDLNERYTEPAAKNVSVGSQDNLELENFKILDDSIVPDKLRNAVYSLLGSGDYAQQKGYNKKVLTVGLPLGFSQKLKQKVSITSTKKQRGSFTKKQEDIVSVNVYKVDLQNTDIVYKPLKFLFELSRYPIRTTKSYLDVSTNMTLDDLVKVVPTRNFDFSDQTSVGVSYWAPKATVVNGLKAAFTGSDYDFLSDDEKGQIVKNHISSYLIETYIRMLTGMSLNEGSFDLREIERPHDIDIIATLVNSYIEYVSVVGVGSKSGGAGGVLFTATGKTPTSAQTASSVSGINQFSAVNSTRSADNRQTVAAVATSLSNITDKGLTAAVHGLKVISNLANMVTPLADTATITKKYVAPKLFDRVFNVVIDPDDFEIDYDKTVKGPYGKQAFEQLMKNGEISTQLMQNTSNVITSMNDQFKFRDRMHTQGDLVFEKYFITVETYGEDQV